MSQSQNPYEASAAALPEALDTSVPPALLATLACYMAHYVLEVLSLWGSAYGDAGLVLPVAAINGTYCVAMCFALWRRWQWARVWLVITTVISAFVLVMLMRRGMWSTEWMTLLSCLLRIAVAAMLFLPPMRRWFSATRA